MKNWKRGARRAVCALLTAAMLCSDAGLAVCAAKMEKGYSQEAGQTQQETQVQEGQAEGDAAGNWQEEKSQTKAEQPGEDPAQDGSTEEPSTGEERPGENPAEGGSTEESSTGEEQPGENPAEGGSTEEPSAGEEQPGKNPTEGGNAEESSAGERQPEEDPAEDGNTEAPSEEEKQEDLEKEDDAPEEVPDAEDMEEAEGTPAEETVSGNDIGDAETNAVMAAEKISELPDDSGEYTENGSHTKWEFYAADGRLVVTGTGEVCSERSGMNEMPWKDHFEAITSAEIRVTGMTDASHLFHGCQNLARVDLTGFDTSKVTNMESMFAGCYELTDLDVSGFRTDNVTNMAAMFNECKSLTSLDVSGFCTDKVTSMYMMFGSCYELTGLDVSSFNTGNVTTMHSMFRDCRKLTGLDVSSFHTDKVTDMRYMFCGCNALADLNLSSFNTVNVTSMGWMFQECRKLTSLDLSSFNAEKVDGKSRMFYGCTDLEVIHTPCNMKAVDNSYMKELGTWFQPDGVVTQDLPTLDHSIIIMKGRIPLEVTKTKTAYRCGEEINLDDMTVIYRPDTTEERELGSDEYESNAGVIDMTKPGRKALIITYKTDKNYIGKVELTVTSEGGTEPEKEKVHMPCADPASGTVDSGTGVTLTCDTPGAVIYYVTGKNAEMLALSKDEEHRYTGPVVVLEDMEIKAVAVKDGMEDSDAGIFAYKVKTTVNAPTAEPGSGTVNRGSYITLKTDPDAEIYYTTDESDPVSSATAVLYEKKIIISGEAGSRITIKAAARKNGIYSGTASFTYTISEKKEEGLRVMFAGREEFTYTGSAIKPAVIVSYNGEEMTEGVDYTLKYANNKNAAKKDAAKAPRITVTGKGNLFKSTSLTFTINPKDIGDEKNVVGSGMVVENGKKASPVLFYNNTKLGAKDFTNPNAQTKYTGNTTIEIEGRGNFCGTRRIGVRVMNKKDMKKLTVVVDNKALKKNPLVYDGTEKRLDGFFKVYDSGDKKKANPLKKGVNYAVVYPENIVDAGKVTFLISGLGEYCGTKKVSYTIKPKAVKKEADGKIEVNVPDGGTYPYQSGGAVIPGLAVTCNDRKLVRGKDYKVTYSANKKVCTKNNAKCKITFLGNYKGSTAITRNFNISAINLNAAETEKSVVIGDKVYTGKRGTYKSAPYVTVEGVLLKKADYKTFYYVDMDRKTPLDGKNAFVDLSGQNRQTVYVKIEGKGNYSGTLTAQYDVIKPAESAVNLSKTRIKFPEENRAAYTGEEVRPAIMVEYKQGRDWIAISTDEIGTSEKQITVTYINNVARGKATVMITGDGVKYVGSRTAVFRIVQKSMKD